MSDARSDIATLLRDTTPAATGLPLDVERLDRRGRHQRLATRVGTGALVLALLAGGAQVLPDLRPAGPLQVAGQGGAEGPGGSGGSGDAAATGAVAWEELTAAEALDHLIAINDAAAGGPLLDAGTVIEVDAIHVGPVGIDGAVPEGQVPGEPGWELTVTREAFTLTDGEGIREGGVAHLGSLPFGATAPELQAVARAGRDRALEAASATLDDDFPTPAEALAAERDDPAFLALMDHGSVLAAPEYRRDALDAFREEVHLLDYRPDATDLLGRPGVAIGMPGPAGTWHGLILDRETGAVLGWISEAEVDGRTVIVAYGAVLRSEVVPTQR